MYKCIRREGTINNKCKMCFWDPFAKTQKRPEAFLHADAGESLPQLRQIIFRILKFFIFVEG